MGKLTDATSASGNGRGRRSSSTARQGEAAVALTPERKAPVEPGALAVNPSSFSSPSTATSSSTSATASTSSSASDSSIAADLKGSPTTSSSSSKKTLTMTDASHTSLADSQSSLNFMNGSNMNMNGSSRRRTQASTIIEPDLMEQLRHEDSMAEPMSSPSSQVGAHAMRNPRQPHGQHKSLQTTMPAGSHAALSRQAHQVHKGPRQSLPTGGASTTSIGSRRSSSILHHHRPSTGRSSLSSRNSSVSSNVGSLSSLHARLDQDAKWGQRLSSRSSLATTVGVVTQEVDVDDLIMEEQQGGDRNTQQSIHPKHKNFKGDWSSRRVGLATASSAVTLDPTLEIPPPDETEEEEVDRQLHVERGLPTNMVSAHLVVEDPEANPMTEEERNALFQQAQRDAEEAVKEKMMQDMVLAEAVVEEDGEQTKRRRRRWWCCGGMLLLLVFLGGALAGSEPWNKYKQEEDGTDVEYVPPPSNNLCTGAISMEYGTDSQFQQGTTVGATDSKFPSCTSRDGEETFTWAMGSVWYSVVGTGSALKVTSDAHRMVDDNNQTLAWNTELSIFAGECGMLSCVGSTSVQNGGSDDDDDAMMNARITWFAEAGVEYFVCVHGDAPEEVMAGSSMSEEVTSQMMDSGGMAAVVNAAIHEHNLNSNNTLAIATAGNFSLVVNEAVGNDFCPGAIDLTVNPGNATMIQGTTTGSTVDKDFHFCAGTDSSAGGVWYRTIGTGNPLEVSIKPEEGFNTQVTVFEQPGEETRSCNLLECAAGDKAAFRHSSQVTWPSSAGSVYYILVHGVSGEGDFDLNIQENAMNDMCEGAIPMLEDEPSNNTATKRIEGTTEGASLVAPMAVCGHAVHTGAGVWHQVEGTGNQMRVSTCNPDWPAQSFPRSVLENTVVSVFQGKDCDDLECIAGDDSSCGTHGAVTWATEEGVTYHILISGKFEEAGAYQLFWETL